MNMPGLYLDPNTREKGQTMPHDISLRTHKAPRKPALAPIAAILLAAMAIAMIAPANAPDSANNASAPQIEDWHGNVMRSHWGNGVNAR